MRIAAPMVSLIVLTSILSGCMEESESSSGYLVTVTEEIVPFASGSEYVNDGETLTLIFNTDLIELWPNMRKIGCSFSIWTDGNETILVWIKLLRTFLMKTNQAVLLIDR